MKYYKDKRINETLYKVDHGTKVYYYSHYSKWVKSPYPWGYGGDPVVEELSKSEAFVEMMAQEFEPTERDIIAELTDHMAKEIQKEIDDDIIRNMESILKR